MNVDSIVVGLGNPGTRYAFTKHNAGFLCLDVLTQDFGASFDTHNSLAKSTQAFHSLITIDGKKVLLFKPQTFMNRSGESLAILYSKFQHLRAVPLIVIHDEVDIPMGRLRVKLGGSDAGHNGLKSIRAALGHGDYYRIRMGVGRPPRGELVDHVLDRFSKEEEPLLMTCIQHSIEALRELLREDLAAAQVTASKC